MFLRFLVCVIASVFVAGWRLDWVSNGMVVWVGVSGCLNGYWIVV